MKSKSGFTIVELLVALVIIALMASLMGVSYIKIQSQSRDAKRKADIETLASLLEKYYDKNGEYPTGCSKYLLAQKSSCGTVNMPITTNTDVVAADLPLATLKQDFPQLPNDFGDPRQSSAGYPFGLTANSTSPHYMYMGQYDSNTTSAITANVMNVSSEINCSTGDVYESTPAGALPKSTTFVLAYLSELDQKWYIYQGKHGYELVNVSGTKMRSITNDTKCVFVQ